MTKLQCILICILQALDGILTYTGIRVFNSIDIEGNPLVKSLIKAFGAFEALLYLKCLGIFVVLFLYCYIKNRKYNHKAEYINAWWFVIGVYSIVVYQWICVLWTKLM